MLPNIEISEKIGYSSACIRDISEILALVRGFLWSCYRMVRHILPRPTPCCHGNEIWDKI